MLTENEFDALAEKTLGSLLDSLDGFEDDLDVELAAGILQLDFEDGTRYLVNSHRAARQIWMAAARNAWHFNWDPAREAWLDSKTGDELFDTLQGALDAKLPNKIQLSR